MEDYYQILEISPQASFAEIKSAYRILCKEYHPDKLPPGTPEKARQYIEERFKQISEAYSVLINEAERQKYDQQNSYGVNTSRTSSPKPPPPQPERNQTYSSVNPVFDTERLKQVAQRLEAQKQEIEIEYKTIEREINQSVREKLQFLGHQPEYLTNEYLKGETLAKKITIFVISILNGMAGLWFMGLGNANLFSVIIGGAWAGGWLVYGLIVVFVYSTLNTKIAEQVKFVRDQASLEKYEAKEKKNRLLQDIHLEQRRKIDYFKYIPIITISPDYIAALSDEDQFYLLQAISEREDSHKLNANLKTAVTIIAQLGILAVLFGLRSDRF